MENTTNTSDIKSGAKVLIKGKVDGPALNNTYCYVELPSTERILVNLNDLTVCETAQSIDQVNQSGSERPHEVTEWLDEPLPTPSFKAGQEVTKHGDKIHALKVSEWVDAIYCCPHPNQTSALKHIVTDVDSIITWSTSAIRPIPAQPTVESELYSQEFFDLMQQYRKTPITDLKRAAYHFEAIKSWLLAWHHKYPSKVEVIKANVPARTVVRDYYQAMRNRKGTSRDTDIFDTVYHFITRKEAGNGNH